MRETGDSTGIFNVADNLGRIGRGRAGVRTDEIRAQDAVARDSQDQRHRYHEETA